MTNKAQKLLQKVAEQQKAKKIKDALPKVDYTYVAMRAEAPIVRRLLTNDEGFETMAQQPAHHIRRAALERGITRVLFNKRYNIFKVTPEQLTELLLNKEIMVLFTVKPKQVNEARLTAKQAIGSDIVSKERMPLLVWKFAEALKDELHLIANDDIRKVLRNKKLKTKKPVNA